MTTNADPQDPLPEASWLWRRVLVFLGELSRVLFVAFTLYAIYSLAIGKDQTRESIEGLYNLAWWVLAFSALDRVLYLVAPTAEQLVRLIQSARMYTAGVQTAEHMKKDAEGNIDIAKTVGQPPAPPLPTEGVAPPAETEAPVEEQLRKRETEILE